MSDYKYTIERKVNGTCYLSVEYVCEGDRVEFAWPYPFSNESLCMQAAQQWEKEREGKVTIETKTFTFLHGTSIPYYFNK